MHCGGESAGRHLQEGRPCVPGAHSSLGQTTSNLCSLTSSIADVSSIRITSTCALGSVVQTAKHATSEAMRHKGLPQHSSPYIRGGYPYHEFMIGSIQELLPAMKAGKYLILKGVPMYKLNRAQCRAQLQRCPHCGAVHIRSSIVLSDPARPDNIS